MGRRPEDPCHRLCLRRSLHVRNVVTHRPGGRRMSMDAATSPPRRIGFNVLANMPVWWLGDRKSVV